MAQEAKHYIDDYFKDRLYDYSPPAPDDMWMKINSQTKKSKKIALWVTFGSVAASLIIFISLGIGYYIGSNNTRKQLSLQNDVLKENSTLETTENRNIKNREKPKSINTGKSKSVQATEQIINLASNTTTNNKVNKDASIPYYIEEKPVHLNTIQVTPLTKLPERRSSRLMTSKEVYAYYFEKNNEPELLAEKPKNHNNNWELGGVVAPLYSKWNIQNNNLYTSEYVSSVESAILAYTGGLNVSYSSSRWKFETGLNYSWSNQDLEAVADNLRIVKVSNSDFRTDTNDPIKINDEPHSIENKANKPGNSSMINNNNSVFFLKSKKDPNTTYFITNNSKSYEQAYYNSTNKNQSEVNRSMEQSSKYLSIPFIAHYKIIDKKADVFLSGGFSTNVLIKAKRHLELENTTYKLDSLITNKTFNYSGIIGLNIEIPIVNRLSVKMEPCLNYNLNSIEKSNNVRVYPYALGMYSGIFYKF